MNEANKESSWTAKNPKILTLNTQQHKIDMQKNQLKVILNDFKKTKNKCETLFFELGEEFINKDEFDKMQKTAAIKTQLLDLQGIVELKNQLIRALTQLYDVEHQLTYKRERNQLRYNSPQVPKVNKLPQFPPQVEKFTLEVPIYNSRQQQNIAKIERVSSYLYDLRKNMRRLSTAIFKNYETTDFLMNQPQYLQLKEKVERYKMRSEQLASILQKKISQQISRFISSCECLQENDEFKVIKVYDSDVRDLGRWYELTQTREWDDEIFREKRQLRDFKANSRAKPELSHARSDKDIRSLRSIRSNLRKDQSELKKQRQKDPQSTSVSKDILNTRLNKRLQKQDTENNNIFANNSDNNIHMLHKLGTQNEKNLNIIESLASLRSKRKKIFNDDIWEEFQKI